MKIRSRKSLSALVLAAVVFAAGADRKLTLTGFRLDAAALGGGDATMKADAEGPQGSDLLIA